MSKPNDDEQKNVVELAKARQQQKTIKAQKKASSSNDQKGASKGPGQWGGYTLKKGGPNAGKKGGYLNGYGGSHGGQKRRLIDYIQLILFLVLGGYMMHLCQGG